MLASFIQRKTWFIFVQIDTLKSSLKLPLRHDRHIIFQTENSEVLFMFAMALIKSLLSIVKTLKKGTKVTKGDKLN